MRAAQTRHVLETIRITLEAAGASLADVAFNHIFLTDWADYPAMNAVYAEYFPGAKPARYCIQCGLVKPGLRRRDRQRGAYRLMARDRRPLLRRARPGGRAAADPLGRPRRLGGLLGAQSRRAGRAIIASSSTIIAAPGAATATLPDRLSVEDMADDVLALMDGLGLARASLVGHAAGGCDRRSPSRSMRPSGSTGSSSSTAWPRPDPHFVRCFETRLALLRDSGVAGLHPRPADLPLSGPLDLREQRAARCRGGATSSRISRARANVEARIAALARLRRRRPARRDRARRPC